MELILLSGNSVNTKGWIESVEEELRGLFDSTHIQYYKHWKSGEKLIDIEYELDALIKYLENKGNYIIFAKSAGSIIALKGIAEGKLSPEKCMFAGVPIKWCDELNLPVREWIKDYSTPTFFIQKTNDPIMDAKGLNGLLESSKVKKYKFIEIKGNDHHYENLTELRNLMKELLSVR